MAVRCEKGADMALSKFKKGLHGTGRCQKVRLSSCHGIWKGARRAFVRPLSVSRQFVGGRLEASWIRRAMIWACQVSVASFSGQERGF